VSELSRLSLLAGRQIVVRALRADGSCFRWWNTAIERAGGNGPVTLSPPGGYTHDAARGDWTLKYYLRTFYWFDRFYNLISSSGSPPA